MQELKQDLAGLASSQLRFNKKNNNNTQETKISCSLETDSRKAIVAHPR